MRVRDIMEAEVVTLELGDALDIADDIMKLGRVRHLPVVNRSGRLVGVVTQRDLLAASLASVVGAGRKSEREWLSEISVHKVMSTKLETIGPDADAVEAVDRMLRRKVGCLPVVQKGKLVGLVTETDCLRCLRGLLADGERRAASG